MPNSFLSTFHILCISSFNSHKFLTTDFKWALKAAWQSHCMTIDPSLSHAFKWLFHAFCFNLPTLPPHVSLSQWPVSQWFTGLFPSETGILWFLPSYKVRQKYIFFKSHIFFANYQPILLFYFFVLNICLACNGS